MRRVIDCVERKLVKVAEKSMGKSIPWFCHKVQKPEGIEQKIFLLRQENEE